MTAPATGIDRLRHSIALLGWGGTLLLGLDRVLRALSGGRAKIVAYALTAQPIGMQAARVPGGGGSTEISALDPAAVDDPRRAAIPRPPEVVATRFALGAECLVATVRGQLAGMHWLSRGQYLEDEVRCSYELVDASRSVWDFDVYVDPAFRGSRVFARLWQAADERLAAQGVRWSFSRISVLNPASMAAHARMHARTIGHAIFLVAGRWQLSLFTQAPFVHVSLSEASGPRLILAPPADERPSSRSGLATPVPTPAAGNVDTRPRSPAALVLGLDSHGLSVVRALADAGVTVYALEPDQHLPGVKSNRVRRVFRAADFSAKHLLPALQRARAELSAHDEVALLANNDRQVSVIAAHLLQLQPLYRIAWADQAAQILRLQRKSELESVSIAQGLNYPRSVLFDSAALPEHMSPLRPPIILKPVQPLSSFKTLLLQSADEVLPALQGHPHDLPILGQEYIAGGDEAIYFGALMLDRGRVLHAMAGRKIASHPPARGQTTIAVTADEPEVLRLTEQFFGGMGLSGPVSLELKRDPAGKHWVIEPTVGRTDFWAELCIGAGFNQPLMEYELALGLPMTAAGPPRHCVWYDTERDPLAYLRLCRDEATLAPRSARQLFPYAGRGDMAPLWRGSTRAAAAWVSRRWPRAARPSE